ncbi:MAG: tetratricopeptide repeat protein [Candidatus Acidiferrales bacterium]
MPSNPKALPAAPPATVTGEATPAEPHEGVVFSNKILISLLIFISLLCYGNTLLNGFVYDDDQQILQNPYVKSWHYVPQIFGTTVWSFIGQAGATNYYRPLMTLSFLVLWHVFGQLPFGFHLFSILMNALVVFLVFDTGCKLFNDRRIAWISAVIFAVHPIHTEVVAWIAALPDLEATFFLLLALSLLATPGKINWKRSLGIQASFLLALLCKEPALMFGVLAIIFLHGVRIDRDSTPTTQKILEDLPFCIIGLCYLGLRIVLFGKVAPVLQHPNLSWSQAIYSGFSLIYDYAKLLVWPAHLSAFHVFHPSNSPADPHVLAGVAISALAIAGMLILQRKTPSAAFAILWMGVTLGPVLNARWMAANVLTERYLYLPSVGFCWLVGWCAVQVWDALARLSTPLRVLRFTVAALLVAAAALGSAKTILRNTDWRNDLTLYTRTLATDPDAHVIRSNLGGVYFDLGQAERAGREWEIALAGKPDNVVTMNALGMLYTQQGKHAEANAMFQRAIAAKPLWGTEHYNYGLLLQKMGETDRALEEFKSAVQLSPLDATARRRYGEALLATGNLDEAEVQLKSAIDLEPSLEALHSLTQVYLQMKKYDQAETQLRRIVEEYPFDSAAHFQLARLLEMSKHFDEAKKEYLEGLKTDAANAEAKSAIQRIEQEQRKRTQIPQ